MLICGASFAGLAVARELAGSGADVLVVDRYEIGERQTSACAIPTPWLEPMGIRRAVRQELECMSFHTPHGTARHRLPWTWSSFDYRTLCEELWEQCGDARFEIAKVEGRSGRTVHTDRGDLTAALIVDALGWRRVLGPGANVQPPEARISRGLEVHPEGGGVDLDVWIDRSLVPKGYAWSVPAARRAARRRRLLRAARPRQGADARDRDQARRAARPLPGQLVPAPAAPGHRGRRVLRRRRGRPLLPALGRGDPHRVLLRHRLRPRVARACSPASAPASEALRRYGAFSRRHARAFAWALLLQRLIPALPPRLLARAARAGRPPPICRPRVLLVPAPGRSGLRRPARSADFLELDAEPARTSTAAG